MHCNMKRFIKSLIALSGASLLVLCCTPKEPLHQSGEPDLDGCYGVYFPKQEASGSHILAPTDPTTASFTVARKNTEGSITVPIVVEDTKGDQGEDIFQIDEITFEDGQAEATFEVNFPEAKEGVQYDLGISVADPKYALTYTSLSTRLDYSVMRVVYQYLMNESGSEKAKVHFTQGFWGEEHEGYIKYYEVDGVRYCTTETDVYHYPAGDGYDAYDGYGFWGVGSNEAEGSQLEFNFIWYTDDFRYINPDDKDFPDPKGYKVQAELPDGSLAQGLQVQKQYLCAMSQGDAYVNDWYNYWLANGYTPEQLGTWFWSYLTSDGCPQTGNYPLSYYDGRGGFYFNLKYYIPGVGSYTSNAYDVVGIAEGYTRTDFSLKAYSGYSDKGKIPFSFETGADVAAVKYEIYEGELSGNVAKSKAAEIAADATAKTVDLSTGGIEVTLEATGVYTLVAASMKSASEYSEQYDYVVFNYVAAEDDEDNAVSLICGAEDISSRYASKGLDKTNSFTAYFCGTDVTELHYAAVSTEKFQNNADTYFSLIKSGAKGVSVVSKEADLAALNSAEGWSDIFSGLEESTSYTVGVWATNGVKEIFASAEYTTAGVPADWEKIGVGNFVYTQLFGDGKDKKSVVTDLELFKDKNHEGVCKIANWGAGVDFKFILSEDGSINVPSQITGATNPNYSCDYMVEDMTNTLYEDFLAQSDDSFDNYAGSHYDAQKKLYEFDLCYWSDVSSIGPQYAYYPWTWGVEYFVLSEGWDAFAAEFFTTDAGDDSTTSSVFTLKVSGEGLSIGSKFDGKAEGIRVARECKAATFTAKSIDASSVKAVAKRSKKSFSELSLGMMR